MTVIERLKIDLGNDTGEIILGRDILKDLSSFCNLNRKVLVVTDSGVPAEYAEPVLAQCAEGHIIVLPSGEQHKTLATWQTVLEKMLELGFSRKDLVIALGGGMIGDLAGFAAASFMRGVDFINIPTTTLSQIDSSIGGKTAVDLNGVKNIVGAFWQPKLTCIDFELLASLPRREFNSGLVEAIKAGLIADAALFERFETLNVADIEIKLPELISAAIKVKQKVVEADEKEAGLRQILNFGHSLGHGIESYYQLNELLHGEAVGIGMLLITEDEKLRKRIENVLLKFDLPVTAVYDKDAVFELVCHDKKAAANTINLIKVEVPGKAEIVKTPIEEIRRYL